MHAIIKTGGKQYRVAEGDEFRIEKLAGVNPGDTYTFDTVLAVGTGDDLRVGAPLLDGGPRDSLRVGAGSRQEGDRLQEAPSHGLQEEARSPPALYPRAHHGYQRLERAACSCYSVVSPHTHGVMSPAAIEAEPPA